jgi:hypothetical protein
MRKAIMQTANRSWMCKADTAAGHETAAEGLTSEAASEAATDPMSAEAAASEAAAMAATEAAASVATTATATTTGFSNARRSSDEDRRSKCSFDCECRDVHFSTHHLRKPHRLIQTRAARSGMRQGTAGVWTIRNKREQLSLPATNEECERHALLRRDRLRRGLDPERLRYSGAICGIRAHAIGDVPLLDVQLGVAHRPCGVLEQQLLLRRRHPAE